MVFVVEKLFGLAFVEVKFTTISEISCVSLIFVTFQVFSRRILMDIFHSNFIVLKQSLYTESKMDAMASLCTE